MNLQNKSEFKKFVKEKIRDGDNISICNVFQYGLHNVSLHTFDKHLKLNLIISTEDKQKAKNIFNMCNQWLAECEDETSVHFAIYCSHAKCGFVYGGRVNLITTTNSQVTCKRCLKEMEK